MPNTCVAAFPGNSCARLLLFLSIMTPGIFGAGADWVKTSWQGEDAWMATQGAVRAVVTEARSRLIYIGSPDGACNLLNAPVPREPPTAGDPSPNQGGHRFWLGPQRRWIWPPLGEWEYSPAAGVSAAGALLTVVQMRRNPEYPAVTREYAWEGGRLRCTARWRDDGRPYFGIHVVPVDVPFAVTARLVRWDEVPDGAVAAKMDGREPDLALPHPSISVAGDLATVASGHKTVKVGFAPQALTIARPGGWTLSVQPGPWEGVALGSPDHGYLSQVWVGSPKDRLAELEQLTPYLRGDANGNCSSTIYIEATPPGR